MSSALTGLPRFPDPTAFEQWALQQRGRWELHDGVPVEMAAERAVHAEIRAQCWLAFRSALRAKSLPCKPCVDGLWVPGRGARRFQPDVIVVCRERVAPDAIVVERPVILVEVLSASTELVDSEMKLESYFELPSVQHYLLISTRKRLILHHNRLDERRLLTSLHVTGDVDLEHPGIRITVEDVYDGIELAEPA